MNKGRRKRIEKLIEQMQGIKVELEEIQQEEQDSIDNLPENLQSSAKADIMSGHVDNLSAASDDLDSSISNLEAVCQE